MQTHYVRDESDAAPIIGTFAITQSTKLRENFFSAPVKYIFIYTFTPFAELPNQFKKCDGVSHSLSLHMTDWQTDMP